MDKLCACQKVQKYGALLVAEGLPVRLTNPSLPYSTLIYSEVQNEIRVRKLGKLILVPPPKI